jgi:methionyl-tRNA formyltransferase
MIPWPVAWTMMDGKRMKIFRAEIVNIESSVQAGEAFIENGDLYIGTVNPSRMLKIEELQIEGKNKMKSKDYIRGLH